MINKNKYYYFILIIISIFLPLLFFNWSASLVMAMGCCKSNQDGKCLARSQATCAEAEIVDLPGGQSKVIGGGTWVEGGVCNTQNMCVGGYLPYQSEIKITEPIKFNLQIPIPGSQIFTGEPITIDNELLGKYIAALYKFFVGALAIIAVVLIMIGGFQWLMSAGASDRVSRAKETISGAIVGLVLALTSYLLLYTLNPNLVSFGSLAIETILPQTYASGLVQFDNIPNLNFTGTDSEPISQEETYDALLQAAVLLQAKNKTLIVNSGTRSLQQQQAEYNQYCPNGQCQADHPVCVPSESCPHVSGKAVDIGNYTDSDVIEALKTAGFCRLSSEAWHFEKPKVSQGCIPIP